MRIPPSPRNRPRRVSWRRLPIFVAGALATVEPSTVGAQSQSGGVEGRVFESEGTPIYLATVQLISAGESETIRGAETDRVGYYRIEDVAPGRYVLRVVRFGFDERRRDVSIVAGERAILDVTLAPAAVQLTGVSVEAERNRERSRFRDDAGATVRELAGAELQIIPGFAEPDPLRAMELLPGVISTSDFSSAFNVRGGSADQNLILLDGIPIFNPFHLGGLFSVFNTDMIARAELQSGGFAAEYGGRVSSVLNVESDPGGGDLQGDAGLSLLATRLALGGGLSAGLRDEIGLQRARWRVSARRSYFDALLKPVFDFPYHLMDFQGVFEGWTKGGSRLSVTAYSGDDVLRLTNLDEEDFPLRVDWTWGNTLVGARLTSPHSGGGMTELRAGYSRFATGLRFPDFDDTDFSSRISQLILGADVERRVGRHWTVKGGAGADRLSYDNLAVSGGTEFASGNEEGWLLGSYLQGTFREGEDWIVEVGGRVDLWTGTRGDRIVSSSPRLSVKRFFGGGDLAVKASAGRYTQFLHSLRDEELPLGLDVWVVTGRRAPHVESDQVQLGIEGFFGQGWFVSLEGYARSFDGVITNNLADDPNDKLDDLLAGDGYAYGADLYVRRSGPGLGGWLTVSLLRTERSFPDFQSGLTPPPDITYPPLFDRRVDVDLVLRRDLPWGVETGIRWNLGTGLPYTRPRGSYYYLSPRVLTPGKVEWAVGDEDDDGFGAYGVALGPRNAQRYPTYHRLDVGFRKTITRSWGVLTPYLNILNVYNRRNVLFYFFEYDQLPPVRSGISMFPVLPSLGMEVSF